MGLSAHRAWVAGMAGILAFTAARKAQLAPWFNELLSATFDLLPNRLQVFMELRLQWAAPLATNTNS